MARLTPQRGKIQNGSFRTARRASSAQLCAIFPGQSPTDNEKPNLGLLALAKHRAIVGNIGGNDHSDSFTFTLSQPTQVTLSLNGTSAAAGITLVRTGRKPKVIAAAVEGVAGGDLVRSLDAGTYAASVSSVRRAVTGYTFTVATDSVAAPSRLEAQAWGGNSVHLNWNDNTTGESGYLVQRYTHNGWKNVETVPANSTAAVIDRLVPSATTTYRVQAVGIKKPLAKGHQRLRTTVGRPAVQRTTRWRRRAIRTRPAGTRSRSPAV